MAFPEGSLPPDLLSNKAHPTSHIHVLAKLSAVFESLLSPYWRTLGRKLSIVANLKGRETSWGYRREGNNNGGREEGGLSWQSSGSVLVMPEGVGSIYHFIKQRTQLSEPGFRGVR